MDLIGPATTQWITIGLLREKRHADHLSAEPRKPFTTNALPPCPEQDLNLQPSD